MFKKLYEQTQMYCTVFVQGRINLEKAVARCEREDSKDMKNEKARDRKNRKTKARVELVSREKLSKL